VTTAGENRTTQQKADRWPGWLGVTLLVLLSPLILVGLICHLVPGLLLLIGIWCWWLPRGKSVLFVHSDSPVWHDYLGANVLNRLDERAVILNWSERRRWRLNLSVLAFWYFGGRRAFNPLGIVIRLFRLPRVFRFYEPFRDFKHGKTDAVEKMTREFLECSLGRGAAAVASEKP
jgi:hypothetical protein